MKLTDLPPAWTEDLLPTIRDEIARSGRRLVVLDDDPTGTQTSHGVLVVTEWSEDELASALQEDPAHRPTCQALADYYTRQGDAPTAKRFRLLAQQSPAGSPEPLADLHP